MEEPPKKFFRLAPGREVRFRSAYLLTCTGVEKDPETGEIIEIRCTYDPETKGGSAPDGRKVKSTIHWVSAEHAVKAEVRLYDTLFTKEFPEDTAEDEDFTSSMNPKSLEVLEETYVEPSVAELLPGTRVQFERLGYFCVDTDSTPEKPVINRTVPLRDPWAKMQKKGGGQQKKKGGGQQKKKKKE